MNTSSLVSADDVQRYADDNGVQQHVAAVKLGSPLASRGQTWPELRSVEELKKIKVPNLASSERGDLLTDYANHISDYIQFPPSTIFLHGLGCIAAALNKAFKIEYHFGDTIPVNLYVVTAQPPSTGKSSVNNAFLTPILESFQRLNEIHETERGAISREIKGLERKLETGKMDEYEERETVDKMASKQTRLNEIPAWKPAVSNATVESLEEVAKNNAGMWNIISAESDGLNVAVGASYGDASTKKNIEILLKSWDGEWFSSERIGRNGYSGEVRGSIAVLAQDDTVDTMLAAGESGRGLTERFYILSERSYLGQRDHEKQVTFNKPLKARYKALIQNIVMEDDVTLNFSLAAEKAVQLYKCGIEHKMQDGGEYSSNMLTGFIGKADKQIRKTAAILHCIDNWQDGGQRSRTVNDDFAHWAIGLFDELSKTFVNAADFMGYSGVNSEVQKLIIVFSEFAQKGKLKISTTVLREKIRNVKPFRGSRDIANKLVNEVLPRMESLNYIVVDGQTIYINPRLK